MKIGVIGWYGHENLGDERILSSLKTFFSDDELLVFDGWGAARRSLDVLNRCDYVLIGGGGLILRGCNVNCDIVEQLKVPFSCVGISVEADHRDLRDFLDIVKEKADRIILRDRESARIFADHPKTEVTPDLTFLYPIDIADVVAEDVCGLNLRPWFYWKAQLHSGKHRALSRLDRHLPFFAELYPFAKWSPDRFFTRMTESFASLKPTPFYFETGQENDFGLMRQYFDRLPATLQDVNYTGMRFWVGMRFHAVLLSLQAGIPFISLSYQPKNVNFCIDAGLAEWSVDIYDWEGSFADKVNRMKENHALIREQLLDLRSQYSREVRTCMVNFSKQFMR